MVDSKYPGVSMPKATNQGFADGNKSRRAIKRNPERPDPRGLQSVIRTFQILEYLARNNEAGITELANELGQSKSATFRFLSTLKSLGYVRQDSKKDKYKLTLRLFEISSKATEHDDVIKAARPVIEELASETGESVYLAVLERDAAVYIDKIDSAHLLRMFSHIGRSAPAHCTALGKVLLAWKSDDYVQRLYGAGGLTPYTRNTIADLGDLKQALASIRKSGVAFDNEEYEKGLKCIAAPIRNLKGEVIAAVSLAAASIRMPNSKMRQMKERILQASRKISHSMGHKQGDNP
jgi:IclR family KDG regulon transcriptional repressor